MKQENKKLKDSVAKGSEIRKSTSESQFKKLLLLGLILIILSGMLIYHFYGVLTVREDTNQMEASSDSCFYNEVEYASGKTFSYDYNLCYCFDGKIKCNRTEDGLKFTEADQVKFENRYNVSVTLPSASNISIDTTPFGERGRENRMTLSIIATDIGGNALDMGWASIDISVYPSTSTLSSFIEGPGADYYLPSFLAAIIGDDSKIFTKIEKWGTGVYVNLNEYEDGADGQDSTLYVFKRENDFIFIDVYINNNVKGYNGIINPILDSLKF